MASATIERVRGRTVRAMRHDDYIYPQTAYLLTCFHETDHWGTYRVVAVSRNREMLEQEAKRRMAAEQHMTYAVEDVPLWIKHPGA